MDELGLVADLGGTNVRFALAGESGALEKVRSYPSHSFAGMAQAAKAYLADTGAAPKRAAIAVAGPVKDNRVHLTNLGWSFSGDDLGIAETRLLNDFEAIALSLGRLAPADLVTIGPQIDGQGTIAIVGPGTGLGVGGAVQTGERVVPLVTEGGHAAFAPGDDYELAVFQHLRREFGRVSTERILSGPGLVRLHEAMCAVDGVAHETLSPEDITKAAPGSHAAKVFDRFLMILGAVAGDIALVMGARGGVMIAGGILPSFAQRLAASGFRSRFEDKGRFGDYMRAIPTRLIVQTHAGLIGAAASFQAMRTPRRASS
jgi:glucokinase